VKGSGERGKESQVERNVVQPKAFDYSSSSFTRVAYYFAEDLIAGKEGIREGGNCLT
jgi:hypothetical protein